MKPRADTTGRSKPPHARLRGVMGLMLSLLVVSSLVGVTAGCTVVEELTTTTPPDAAETSSTSVKSSSTILQQSTTTTASTTTTEPPTTGSTATTLAEVPGTTTTVRWEPVEPAEEVLYEIDDWTEGVSGWAAAGQWKTTGGMLVTDGSSDSFAVAPVDLDGYPDYVIECEAQIVDPDAGTVILLMARLVNGEGYYGGFDGANSHMVVGFDTTEIATAGFVLDSDWHTYRLEVRGNNIRLFLEQAEVARAVDNTRLDPGTVGVYCGGGQINIRSFKVVAL